MESFADQCLDLAQSFLSHNLNSINEDGSIAPWEGEKAWPDESGHAALAIGEFFRATGETELDNYDLVDLCARCITAQVFSEKKTENGLAYSTLGLLSFGPSKERNIVWERLLDPTREKLDKRLLMRSDYTNHVQAFNIAKAVTRFSMGFSKKDETGKLIDRFIERIEESSTGGVFDDDQSGLGGAFDLSGVMCFIFIRQSLQLHANMHLRDRKLPSLRTYAEKYLKLILDLVREDGLGWCYGKAVGAYGQMHCISLIMQAMRDGWISDTQMPRFLDALRRLFHFFFLTYVDREHGYLIVRDSERNTLARHTTRISNFDAVRYLCQWSRLAKSIKWGSSIDPIASKTMGRFISFNKSHKKEQGLFVYNNAETNLQIQLPLISPGDSVTSDTLAFPHCPGIFDWPSNKYLPIMLPELTFGEHVIIPSYYGKRCVTGLGLRKSFYFRYEQPELITKEGRIISGLGSCKVNWTFSGNKVISEFIFLLKQQIQMDSFRYVLALGVPHSKFHAMNALSLGPESLRATVVKDDFQSVWGSVDDVSRDLEYSTYYGNVHYLQVLRRDHPLVMRSAQSYRIIVEFEPDIVQTKAQVMTQVDESSH